MAAAHAAHRPLVLRPLCAALLAAAVIVAGIREPQTLRTLQAAEQGAVLVGQVFDGTSSQPVGGAEVTISRWIGAMTVSDLSPSSSRFVARAVRADSKGLFQFRDLEPGHYALTARAPGFLDGRYGQTRHGGPALSVIVTRTGNAVAPIRLWRGAALSGSVVDANGDPAVGVEVIALRRELTSGGVTFSQSATVRTDDRGEYRLHSLTPGRYVVLLPSTAVTFPDHFVQAYRATTSGPNRATLLRLAETLGGAPNPLAIPGGDQDTLQYTGMPPANESATGAKPAIFRSQLFPAQDESGPSVLLTSGQEERVPAFQQEAVEVFTVSGTIAGPSGGAVDQVLRLTALNATRQVYFAGKAGDAARTISGPDGRFAFRGVPAGTYRLTSVTFDPSALAQSFREVARAVNMDDSVALFAREGRDLRTLTAPTAGATLWSDTTVTVRDQNVVVQVAARDGVRLHGQIEFTGASPRPVDELLARLTVSLVPAGRERIWPSPFGLIGADGRFETAGVPAGRYFIAIPNPPSPWSLQSIIVNGREMIDEALDLDSEKTVVRIVYKDRAAEIVGTVRQSGGEPVPGAQVVLMPADQARWIARGLSPRRVRLTVARADGSFALTDVIPGDYTVVALDPAVELSAGDPEVRAAATAAGTRLTLNADDKRVQRLLPVRIAR